MRYAIAILALLLATTSATAAPHVLREGANHHLGDDSFVARFGRPPTAADGEKLRMRVHLEYVRDLLASRPATTPALEGRRAELLGYLGDYIAKGITPKNTYVPDRNPVFIDAAGNICAVGYLIERSVGRAVPEAIAATHRLDYLEDIAAAMPEVASWIASSGFTLDELASIQPGYPGPEVMHLVGWLTRKDDDGWQEPVGATIPDDGAYRGEFDGAIIEGKFAGKQMVGVWTRMREGKILGKGTFRSGAGTWKSIRADGTRLAEGPFVKSHAHGEWKIFHPSGRLAAVGMMRDGQRDGTWKFFYDNQASSKLAVGRFAAGETIGGWKHFDEAGKLVATASGRAWVGLTLEIAANAAGVRHEIHQGIPAEGYRLDGFYLGKDRLYVDQAGVMFDGDGNQLEKTAGGWVARACKWSRKRKAAAKAGDATTLHDMMLKARWRDADHDEDGCTGKPIAVGAARVKRYERMIASRTLKHAPIPAWNIDPQPPAPADPDLEPTVSDADAEDAGEAALAGADNPDDLATYLTRFMTWYIEWPHVDDTFRAVYRSLPGYAVTES